jgi:hypothetical protein
MMFPAKAGAQNTIKFESLNVELWSEYDKPSVLVISEFVLSKDTPVPAIVTFRFPKDANLMAVAINQNSELFNVNFDGPTEQGSWETIKINVQSYDPHRVEYYQKFEHNGKKRTFDYQWFGDNAVKDLNLSVLIPSDSTDVVTNPILSSTSTNDGFFTGTATKNGLSAGQPFNFTLEYSRDSNAVINNNTSDSPVVQPAEPLGPSTEGRFSIDKMPYVIGGVGVVLIMVAAFFYWRSTQNGKESSPRRRRRQSSKESAEGQAYCHECGTRAHEGDRFCRTCGSRLRVNS